jgi:hypothetical protein
MDSLVVENVRCFGDRQTVRLAPLTLLVGENSSGKSTFLAMCRLAWDSLFQPLDVDFNEEPFFLGGYNEIAHYRGGRAGRSKSFSIGLGVSGARLARSVANGDEPADIVAETMFGRLGAQPGPTQIRVQWTSYSIVVNYSGKATERKVRIDTPAGTHDVVLPRWMRGRAGFDLGEILFFASQEQKETAGRGPRLGSRDLKELNSKVKMFRRVARKRPYALAPIRTHPERTYHPVSYQPRAGGGHVPMVLNRTFSGEPEKWTALLESLDAFGRACGLFGNVEIRRLGKTESDPFQLRVKITGPAFNLVDVGYGVSQVLPILVDALLSERESTLLLQQPEVHLHPRAQAELGTFLGSLAKTRSMQFIVETHSDHLIDRVRLDVRDKKTLSAQDVSILYFERTKTGVRIYEISIDEAGNIPDAPPSYREFFLAEERRNLLG